jgi:hypothetical protein
VRNRLLGAAVAGGRNFGTHIISRSVLENGLTHVASWFLPLSLSGPASGGLLLCGVTLLIIFAVKAYSQDGANTKSRYFIFVFSIFVLTYVAFLILLISFIERGTPLDNRMLSPVYVVALIVLIWMTSQIGESIKAPPFVKTAMLSFIAIVTLMHLGRAPAWISREHLLYGSTKWRTSRIIEYVRNLPADTIIFSNGPDAIYLLANRVTKWSPERAETEPALAAMRANDARLVYFKNIYWRPYLLSLEELKTALSLRVDLDEEDGEVLSTRVTR